MSLSKKHLAAKDARLPMVYRDVAQRLIYAVPMHCLWLVLAVASTRVGKLHDTESLLSIAVGLPIGILALVFSGLAARETPTATLRRSWFTGLRFTMIVMATFWGLFSSWVLLNLGLGWD
ncbi:MAG: hypothetical protein AAB425_13660, partial [Bdellovibrionota bacterium]